MLPVPPTITSRTNARVKELRASLSGRARYAGDLLGLEGEHLLSEAHQAGQTFETIFLREGSEEVLQRAEWYSALRTGEWAVLSRDVFDSAVSTATPQGIVATWIIQEIAARQPHGGDVLIVENLQDPGNLGTLIRSVAAFGMERVFVTPETANQWNPKVVRSAAGAVFQVPVERLPLAEIVARLRGQETRIFAAVSGSPFAKDEVSDGPTARKPSAGLSYDADFEQPCAILVGNEGAGLSAEARALADEQVTIPCSVESLNAAVAGSVLLYEVMRQKTARRPVQNQELRP